MTDRDALYVAILADPDDNTTWLVFAVWLEEYGEYERTVFILKQIALANVPEWNPL
jgi:uncharacterized protein (TIGR02996 family)